MLGVVALGFFIGLQHALEPDHLAAVATLASRHTGARELVRHGLTWGLGHTLTLLLLAGAAMLLGGAIPDSLANVLELCVGVMLVALGANLLARLWRLRVELHAHPHVHGFRWRTLFVGLMHGMAGSAALLVLALTKVRDPATGVVYILVFGLGSMVGMAALSAALSVPLLLSARFWGWAHRALQAAIGAATMALGAATVIARLR
jgi:hypothetical protein